MTTRHRPRWGLAFVVLALLIAWYIDARADGMLGGVGQLMGPTNANSGGGIPSDAITTEAGVPLTTEAGATLVTE